MVELPVKNSTREKEGIRSRPSEALDNGWSVVVWNDPVNLMSYVTYVFMKVLGMNRAMAERHMLEVHEKGKSVVAHESSKERAEFIARQLHSYNLLATIES
ncbi:MAG: ATP-dependent Clp protease adapter ClpS [Methylacidiphilales bacterium]|nr:ATP-dependent Clp protease adapter ClpS [Candidatus Methylacidiphilales bacterium]MDW8349610.1 ATP-dependent Clp protease adapter ClpS [Verrucomicrobiae bacterium]